MKRYDGGKTDEYFSFFPDIYPHFEHGMAWRKARQGNGGRHIYIYCYYIISSLCTCIYL